MNIPDLFLIFRGKLSVYHRFFIDPLYQVEEIPIYSCFESFYGERLDFCLILHVYIEMIILVLYSISMCIQLIYHMLNPLSLSCLGEGNGNPFQCSYLENPRDGEAWWAAIYGVTQSWTQLK